MEPKILLVDDETDFTTVLAERMIARGLRVDTANNGNDGIKLAKANNYDAIILDLAMPGMDGIETLKQLLTRNPDLQIILLTGKATLQQGIEAMKHGAVEFLEKPVKIDVLLEKVQSAQIQRLELNQKHAENTVAEIMKRRGW